MFVMAFNDKKEAMQCVDANKPGYVVCVHMSSALQEARIPPGPRLQILHHLEQYKHILKPGMPTPDQLPLPPQEAQMDS